MPSIQAALAALNKKINSTFAFLAGCLLTVAIIFALLNNSLRNQIEQVKLGNVYAESITYDKLADDVFTTIEYTLSDGTTAQGKVLKGTTSDGQPVGKFYIQLENGGVVEAEIKGGAAFDITQYEGDIKNIVAEQITTEINKLDLAPDQTIINQTITIDLGPDAVKTINIANSAVTNAKIANNAISVSKLANNSVTNTKLADDSVDSDKISDGAITNADISNSANISWGKLDKIGSSIADLSTRNASDINITDTLNYFTSTDVEGALQEVGSISSGIATNYLKLDATNGPITGNLQVNADLGVTGTITGNLTGDVTGDVTGNVLGDLTGNVTGDVSGNAGTVTNGVYTNGSYADPTWITSLAGTKISGNISGNAANVTGIVAVLNGGTGASDAATARTNLGIVSGGTGDIWVEKAGDTMTGDLTFSGAQKIIGGTGTTDDLTFQTTSGVGATGADMHFLVGNNGATEAMTILNDGNIGIGTTSPTTKLYVTGNQVNDGLGKFINTDGSDTYGSGVTGQGYATSGTGYSIGVFGVSNGPRAGGINVGGFFSALGANTNYELLLDTLAAGDDNYALYSAAAAKSYFAGNVGIGTTSPLGKLDVRGTTYFENGKVDG